MRLDYIYPDSLYVGYVLSILVMSFHVLVVCTVYLLLFGLFALMWHLISRGFPERHLLQVRVRGHFANLNQSNLDISKPCGTVNTSWNDVIFGQHTLQISLLQQSKRLSYPSWGDAEFPDFEFSIINRLCR